MGKTSLAVLAVLLCIFSGAVCAQTITASVNGLVLDATGAIVPNAKITATNVGTNITYTATSNEAGVFNILFLPIGQYTVSAEAPGFKKTVLGPFTLEVNQIARVDVKLDSRFHLYQPERDEHLSSLSRQWQPAPGERQPRTDEQLPSRWHRQQ
jgi:hypothetical protein